MSGHQPLPSARIVREDGIKPASSWDGDQLRATRIWRGASYLLGMAGAFAPLVAVVALAIMLLWSAAMAGSP
ncbi:MAG: hypothetical protein KJO07_02950 [Deltaproteobacteria bacterium]|nr:hypothetical protein [Deltaproteobacteria bacterium]